MGDIYDHIREVESKPIPQTDREKLEGEKYWFPRPEKIVQIRFVKTHPEAQLPTKAFDDDNCWDLYAVEDKIILHGESSVVDVGLTLAYISPGFGFVIRPRSGLGFKYSLQPHLGEIDNGYKNNLSVKIYNFGSSDYEFKKGDRIAQIKVEKVWPAKMGWLDEIIPAERGLGGLGSSGK